MNVEETLYTFANEKRIAEYIKTEREVFLCDMKAHIVDTIVDKIDSLYREGFDNRYALIDSIAFYRYVDEMLVRSTSDSEDENYDFDDKTAEAYWEACQKALETRRKLSEIFDTFKHNFNMYVFQLLVDFKMDILTSEDRIEDIVSPIEYVSAEYPAGQQMDTVLFRLKEGYREMYHLIIRYFMQFAYDKLNDYYEEDDLK